MGDVYLKRNLNKENIIVNKYIEGVINSSFLRIYDILKMVCLLMIHRFIQHLFHIVLK